MIGGGPQPARADARTRPSSRSTGSTSADAVKSIPTRPCSQTGRTTGSNLSGTTRRLRSAMSTVFEMIRLFDAVVAVDVARRDHAQHESALRDAALHLGDEVLAGAEVADVDGRPQAARFERLQHLQRVGLVGLGVAVAEERVVDRRPGARRWRGRRAAGARAVTEPGTRDDRRDAHGQQGNRQQPAPAYPEAAARDRRSRPDPLGIACHVEQEIAGRDGSRLAHVGRPVGRVLPADDPRAAGVVRDTGAAGVDVLEEHADRADRRDDDDCGRDDRLHAPGVGKARARDDGQQRAQHPRRQDVALRQGRGQRHDRDRRRRDRRHGRLQPAGRHRKVTGRSTTTSGWPKTSTRLSAVRSPVLGLSAQST